jgi:hypothetical protein
MSPISKEQLVEGNGKDRPESVNYIVANYQGDARRRVEGYILPRLRFFTPVVQKGTDSSLGQRFLLGFSVLAVHHQLADLFLECHITQSLHVPPSRSNLSPPE